MVRNNKSKGEPIEKRLWKAADKLRKNIDAAKYKHIVLDLIFLKYISDTFDFNERFTKLKAEFEEQLNEKEKLNRSIKGNLAKIKKI